MPFFRALGTRTTGILLAILVAGCTNNTRDAHTTVTSNESNVEANFNRWLGRAIFDEELRKFRYCEIIEFYPDSKSLSFILLPSGKYIVSIIDDNWHAPIGSRDDVALYIDGKHIRTLTTTIRNPTAIQFPMTRTAVNSHFRQGRIFTVYGMLETNVFRLAHLDMALAKLESCLRVASDPRSRGARRGLSYIFLDSSTAPRSLDSQYRSRPPRKIVESEVNPEQFDQLLTACLRSASDIFIVVSRMDQLSTLVLDKRLSISDAKGPFTKNLDKAKEKFSDFDDTLNVLDKITKMKHKKKKVTNKHTAELFVFYRTTLRYDLRRAVRHSDQFFGQLVRREPIFTRSILRAKQKQMQQFLELENHVLKALMTFGKREVVRPMLNRIYISTNNAIINYIKSTLELGINPNANLEKVKEITVVSLRSSEKTIEKLKIILLKFERQTKNINDDQPEAKILARLDKNSADAVNVETAILKKVRHAIANYSIEKTEEIFRKELNPLLTRRASLIHNRNWLISKIQPLIKD